MPAIAGAGLGLGLSIARRFGREGFKVALIARTQSRLDLLTTSRDQAERLYNTL